jgi:hypothetical protein
MSVTAITEQGRSANALSVGGVSSPPSASPRSATESTSPPVEPPSTSAIPEILDQSHTPARSSLF